MHIVLVVAALYDAIVLYSSRSTLLLAVAYIFALIRRVHAAPQRDTISRTPNPRSDE